MPIPEHVLRFWRAVDDLFGNVRPTWWGAVVTDGRFPAIWDANYARIDVAGADPTVSEVTAALRPALLEAGAETFHVVCFHPEDATRLVAELSTLGHRLAWDEVMNLHEDPPERREADVVELEPGPTLWNRVQDSMALFGVEGEEATGQLRRIEAEILAHAGKRWFGVRDDDRIVALAALLILEGVGYVDNVATFPEARGRGLATEITARIVRESRTSGAEQVCLFADPDETGIMRMYTRLGFRSVGRIASTKGPIPALG